MNQLFQAIQVLSEQVQFNSQNVSFNNFVSSSHNKSTLYFANSEPYISYNVRVFLIALHCVTSLVALIGNGWVIAVALVCYRSSPFQHIKKYLINLAASDIVISVLCAPFTYSDFIYGQWIFPLWLCPIAQFAQLLGVFVATNTLMIIGIERYTAVRHPLTKIHQNIQAHSYILIALIWICGLYYAYIPMRTFSVEQIKIGDQICVQCNNNIGLAERSNQSHYMIGNFAFTFAAPAVVLAFAYLEIARKMNCFSCCKRFGIICINNQKENEKTNSIKHNLQCELVESVDTKVSIQREKNKNKVTRIILLAIGLYGLCWTPIKLFQLLVQFDIVSYSTEPQYCAQLYIFIGCHWLAMSSTIVNPILYTFTDVRGIFLLHPTLKCSQV